MPCHLIHGTDEYRIANRVAELLDNADLTTEMNFHAFDLDLNPHSFADAIECAMTPPFMGGQRVVSVSGIGMLEKRVRSALDDDEKPESDTSAVELAAELGKLANYSYVVLYDRLRKIDGRGKLYKTLAKACKVEEYKPLFFDALSDDNRELERWLLDRAKAYNVKLTPSGMRELVMRLGSDLRSVEMEMQKFSLAYGPDKEVSAVEVAELTPSATAHSVFNLCDSLGQQKLQSALGFLHGMLAAKSPGPYILTMLARHVRMLSIARRLLDRGASDTDVQSAVGIRNRWVFNRFLPQAHRFDGNYAKAHAILAECDAQLKSSGMEPETALELCVIRLSALSGAAR